MELKQSMEKATLPCDLLRSTLGVELIRSTEKATLPCGLLSLGFGRDFTGSWRMAFYPRLAILDLGLELFPEISSSVFQYNAKPEHLGFEVPGACKLDLWRILRLW
jgi:hypothetical protein